MIRQHAILSWSGAHIWLKCAPSARFQEQIPEENTLYSVEGTHAHELGALVLRYYIGTFAGREDDFTNEYNAKYIEVYNWYVNNWDALKSIYPKQDPKGLADAMCEHAQGYALFVFQIGGLILVEETLDLSRFAALSWGSGDGLNFFPDVIYINDFKFGAGKKVYSDDNDQLKGYALGAYLRAVEMGFDPHTVVMNIIQPRMSSEPSSAQISVTDLLEWAAKTVAPMAQLAIAGQGAFVPGEHCQWCKARTVCSAAFGYFGSMAEYHDPRTITDAQRAFVLQYGDVVIKYIKAIQGDAVKRLKGREAIPGFKLIATQGDRKFVDEHAVALTLASMGYANDEIFDPPSLKGITALESLFKPKRLFTEALGAYIIRPDGNPKLVPEGHAGTEIGTAAANAYDAQDLTNIN